MSYSEDAKVRHLSAGSAAATSRGIACHIGKMKKAPRISRSVDVGRFEVQSCIVSLSLLLHVDVISDHGPPSTVAGETADTLRPSPSSRNW